MSLRAEAAETVAAERLASIPAPFAKAFHCARTDPRWRPVAIITGFFASQIIISTLLLRWHYAIDVVAGLALAGFAAWAAPRIADREAAHRARHALPDPWAF